MFWSTPIPVAHDHPLHPAQHLLRGIAAVTDHNVRALASQLQHTLNAPGTSHILAQAPPQARAAIIRALRGPARLLGVELPSALQFAGPPRPPRIRKPRPRQPRPEGVRPTDRPIPRYVLAFTRHNRRRCGKGA